jgi:TolB-like protein/lipoprotein NlpI
LNLFAELKRRNVLRVGAAYIVTGWLIIQVVETVLPAYGYGDAAIRLVVTLFAVGLIPVLIFAWAFELTPEGLKKEKDIDRSHSITPTTGKKLDRVIMVVLALALGYFAFDKFVLSESREAAIAETARHEGRSEALVESYGEHSIAVLPFVDMSPQGDQEYFSDGISEELLNLLAKIPELRVISRSSAFSYKGKDINLVDVARELNVAHILEGSVRKAGNQVRITAQLIEARTDTHLWSETYDRSLDNIFAVQDEISAMVVEQLKVKLLGKAPKSLETDPAAYSLFLRARYLRRQGSENSLGQSIDLLQQALEIDPNYLPALDDLISAILNQSHAEGFSFEEGYERARELTLKGMEIDPDFGRLYIQLGWIKMFKDGDMQAAASLYQRGLELDPNNVTTMGDTATLLYQLGRLEESIALHNYTNTLDPVHPVGHANQGIILLDAGQYKEAVNSFRKTLELSPNYTDIRYYLAIALLGLGDANAALMEIQKEPSSTLRLTGLTMIKHAQGNKIESGEALQELMALNTGDKDFMTAQVFAYQGDIDKAFEWIDVARANDNWRISELHTNILFSNLHHDPRWLKLLEELGTSPTQLAAIKFEVVLPE